MKKMQILRLMMGLMLAGSGMYEVNGQELKQQGMSVEDIVPQGWLHYEVTGDLNMDGLADLNIMATPNFKERIVKRDDGYERNCNQPVFAVYFATPDGKLKQWKQYGKLLPANDIDNEFCTWNIDFEITDRGALHIGIHPDCSQGSWFRNSTRYTYRYQNGDFYLIGQEKTSVQRNTGLVEVVSENYLTWKRQVKKSNFSEDTPPREKWSRLPKKPLEKLGARKLE